MKLRQRLAMVLASAMVVTAVPVTTTAASVNSFNKTMGTLMDGSEIVTADGLKLKVALNDEFEGEQTFYVESEDFLFNVDVYKELELAGITFSHVGTDTLTVTIEGGELDFFIPIHGTVDGEMPVIVVDGEGTSVSSGKYPIMGTDATVADKALVATVGDATSISTEGVGTITDITIEEVVKGNVSGSTIVIELDRGSDLVFSDDNEEYINVDGGRGLSSVDFDQVESVVIEDDGETLKVTFKDLGQLDRGSVTLKGIKVEPVGRDDVPTGDVEVKISSVEDNMEEIDAVVAVVNDYGVVLTVDEEEEFIAGGATKKVEVTFKELAAGSINDRYDVFFTVEGANVVGTPVEKAGDINLEANAGNDEFTLEFPSDFNETSINTYTYEFELEVEAGSTDDVVIIAESRGFDEDLEVTVGTVVEDREIAVEVANLEVGVRGQEGGRITLEEFEAETFEKGQYLIVELDSDAQDDDIDLKGFDIVEDESGLEFEEVTVYTTGGALTLDSDDGKNDEAKNAVAIKVTRESDEAGTITLENFVFNTNNATPNGTYKVKLTGDLVAAQEGTEIEKDFIVVGEETATEKVEVEVSVSSGYAFNDENGRMLAQLKYICDTFGVTDYMYAPVNGVGVITIFKDGTTIQFINGSNEMSVNGGVQIMDTAAVIKDGRTYVPVRFLANALGLTVANYENGVATITN